MGEFLIEASEKLFGRERAARHDRGPVERNLANLFAHETYPWLAGDTRFDQRRELIAIDCERPARRHRAGARRPDDQRTEARELLLEQPDGVFQRRSSKRVAANELGKRPGCVSGTAFARPHLVKVDLDTAARGLPRRLASGETSTDHGQAQGSYEGTATAVRALTSCWRSAAHWSC